MAEVGLLAPDARVELIEGEIIDMAPIGIPHCSVVDRLTQWLISAVSQEAIVRIQGSFRRLHFFRSLVDGRHTDVSVTSTPGVTELPGLGGKTVDMSRLLTP